MWTERLRRGTGALVAVAVAAACSSSAPPDVRHAPPLRVQGDLLLAHGENGTRLSSLAARSGAVHPLPGMGGVTGLSGAEWTAGGAAFALLQRPRGESGLYRVDPDGGATRVGPAVPGPFLFFGPLGVQRFGTSLLGVRRGFAIVSTCFGQGAFGPLERRSGVSVLELAHPTEWRRIARGCGEALSPDGRTVVSTDRERKALELVSVEGGKARPLLDLRHFPGVSRASVADPRVEGASWGPPGLAVAVANGTDHQYPYGLLVLPTSGSDPDPSDLQVIPLGKGFPDGLAWQPGGRVLAFTDCSECPGPFFRSTFQHPSADLRLYDLGTGRLRDVAASHDGFQGLVWSPRGDVLASHWASGEMLFVEAATGRLEREPVDGVPLDWRAP